MARFDGRESVALEVRRQSGANTMEVVNNVKARLARVQQLLPSGVKLETLQDQSRYISAAFHEVQLHLILGSILASLVVFVFMRDWRATVIGAVAIPASIIATFGMMRALDFTLNNITMLALVLMVGVVIDDAIVVLENIFRFIEEKKLPPRQAAIMATKDIGLAVMATTLSLVVVFLPVSFMSSISGRFLYSFGLTATVAILVSLLVSFSLTPMMSSRMLRPDTVTAHGGSAAASPGSNAATWPCSAGRCPTASPSWSSADSPWPPPSPLQWSVRNTCPPTSTRQIRDERQLPEGTSLIAMQGVMDRLYDDLRGLPGVQHVVSVVGTGYLQSPNSGRLYIQLDDIENRVFSLSRLWRMTLEGRPSDAFRGIYSQRDVMAVAARSSASIPTSAAASATSRPSTRAPPPTTSTSSSAAPNSSNSTATARPSGKRPSISPASPTSTPPSASTNPSSASTSIATAPPTSASTPPTSPAPSASWSAATTRSPGYRDDKVAEDTTSKSASATATATPCSPSRSSTCPHRSPASFASTASSKCAKPSPPTASKASTASARLLSAPTSSPVSASATAFRKCRKPPTPSTCPPPIRRPSSAGAGNSTAPSRNSSSPSPSPSSS
ncbi:MAG: efflux RND transporter permease subunit [Bryobacterales bacterium]|nr:efflux RND transporter permease subunit [Bryobacterales bacterium]